MTRHVFDAWTDYPLLPREHIVAPMRPVRVVGWNGDKRLTVVYRGEEYSVHRCRVYTDPKIRRVFNPARYYWHHLRGSEGMMYERRHRERMRELDAARRCY